MSEANEVTLPLELRSSSISVAVGFNPREEGGVSLLSHVVDCR